MQPTAAIFLLAACLCAMSPAIAGGEGPVEVPVTVRYTRESLAKGQTSLGAVVILRDLLLQYLFGEHP